MQMPLPGKGEISISGEGMNIYQLLTKIFLAFLVLGLVRVFIPPPLPQQKKP